MEGSRAERGYEPNGKKKKKKRVRTEEEGCKWVPGEREVVGLSTGWAGRAQCRAWKHMSPAGWVRDGGGGRLWE